MMYDEPEVVLARLDARIEWVLGHHGTSAWLKQALATAIGRDPVCNANDVEVLRQLLCPRADAWARLMVARSCCSDPGGNG